MNRRKILNVLGRTLIALSLLLLLPIAVSLYFGESCAVAFLITAVISLVIGLCLNLGFRPWSNVIYAREGFAIVALVWIAMSVVGALPFVISGEIPNFVNALFETVSGFTTTGASVLNGNEIEGMSKGLLFWRSFTHWIGGMGVLVFVMALLPNVSDRSIHLLRAEVPGPIVGKLVPKIKDTAKILYIIYIIMTIIEIVLLYVGGMPLFESVVHAFGTAGTGGFGIKADSIASYSPYLQWVIGIFMMLFGMNFNIYYLLLIKKFKLAFKSSEIWCYVCIIATAVALICVNTFSIYKNFPDAIRTSFFQVSSIMTTTGYATVDFNLWPDLSKAILLVLMMVGACSGSTAGGLKVSRVMLIFKVAAKEFRRLMHPRSVNSVKLEGKIVDQKALSGATTYLSVYTACIFVVFLILSIEPNFGFETNFSATLACFNNIGPGFGMVGPNGNYAEYSAISKIVLSFAMLLGRLEIYPMLLVFIPKLWKRD